MKIRKEIIVSLSLTLLSGCSFNVPLKPGAELVKVMKSDPDPKCEEVGSATGAPSMASSDMEPYKNDLRNKAMEKGGNYVRLDTILYHRSGAIAGMQGTIFKCPQ